MSKLKNMFKKVWNNVERLFNKMDEFTKAHIDVAVRICETLKKAIENGNFDLFCTAVDLAIPGDQSVISASAKSFLVKNLPKLIDELQLRSLLEHVDPENWEAQYKAIFMAMCDASDAAQTAIWQGASDKIVEYLSDGVFTKAEKRQFLDWYYLSKIKGTL